MKTAKLVELGRIIPGRHIEEADHNRIRQGVPYLTGPSDFGELQAKATRWTERPDVMCQPLDVLVVVKGAGVGKINVAPPEPACIGRQIMAVRSREGVADPHFVYFAIASAAERLKAEALGATVPGLSIDHLESLDVPTAGLTEQRRLVSRLRELFGHVQQALNAARVQLTALDGFTTALLEQSLRDGGNTPFCFGDVLDEVADGIGENWKAFPVLGATRRGLAPARERPGKSPERYKPVATGTVFYNPMRILIGSIAFVDDDDPPGITSPDYVVLKGKPGIVDSRWFYYWLRSPLGQQCIKSLARGAVRERMLFGRLAKGEIALPKYDSQLKASKALAQIKPMRAAIQRQVDDIARLPHKLLDQAFDLSP